MQERKGAITRRIVDIFKEAPSEDTPQDPLSLDSLLIDPVIEKAIRLVGQKAFNEQVKELKLRFLSNRDKKKKPGRAESLDEDSFPIAAAYKIKREHDQKNPRDSQP